MFAIGKNNNNADSAPKFKPSEILRQVYDDEFFVADLKLPQNEIMGFLFFVDSHMDENSLLKKDNEFQLLDFLVNESKAYRTQMDAEK